MSSDSKQRIRTRIHSTNNYGDVPHIQQDQRGQLSIPTLSLQRGNIALVCDRGSKLKNIDNIFISKNIIDLHLVGSGSYAYPLYIYEKLLQ